MKKVRPVTVTALAELIAVAEVAFLLTAAGLLAAAVWLAAPRTLSPAVAAVPLLAGGAAGLVTLGAGAAAVLLLSLAATSFVLEVLAAPGLLLHAVGGGVALAMGGACLHEPWVGAHPGLVVPVAVTVTLGTWTAGRRSWRVTREDELATGDRLTGRIATVLDVHRTDPHSGYAVVAGQLWRIDAREPLTPGARVRVVAHQESGLAVTSTRVPRP